jgi:hypothetical protein
MSQLTGPIVKQKVGGWVTNTDGCVSNVFSMPEKAQRAVSQSALALQRQRWVELLTTGPDADDRACNPGIFSRLEIGGVSVFKI